MNGRRLLAGCVPVAGPFGGPVASSTRATFPEVKCRSGEITTRTFLTTEELSS